VAAATRGVGDAQFDEGPLRLGLKLSSLLLLG